MRKLQLTMCLCLLLYGFITPKGNAQILASNLSRKKEINIPGKEQASPINAAVTISGRVTDNTGAPMPGVNVALKGTTLGTVTDANGKYSLNVPDQTGTLVFSFVGYISQEVAIGNNTAINVKLEESSKSLNEVVVIGYGTQRKSDLTGALTSVSTKDFAQQPVTRVDQVLSGRAAGVQVTNASGAPGANVRIRVRGSNSVLGNNDPLYVIDGFVGADFSILNPNDIESIQVLKDAASTAIYGSRGANGVIIVTTKKGSGSGFKISYEAQGSRSEVVKRWDVLNAFDYATTANERSVALGTSPIFTQDQVDQFRNNKGTDWQNLVFRRATGQQHQLTLSGGGEKTTYLISANYLDQDGVINNTGFKKYTIRSNVSSKPTDDFSLRLNFTGSRIENHNIGLQSGTGNALVEALSWAPTTPAYDATGHYTSQDPTGSVAINPLALLYDLNNDDNRNIANVIGGANYKLPIKGLAIDLQYGVNYTGVQDASWGGIYLTRGNPFANRSTSDQVTLQSTSSLNYNRTFNKYHNISAVVVFETQKYVQNDFSAAGNTLFFPDLGYYNLSLANSYAVGAGYSKSSLLSYLGRVNYSYKDKYLLSFAVRRDGSSKFADGNKYSTFPSVGAGYNLAEEDFIKGMNVFSNLKLRASWGMTGSQAIGPYATLSTYNTGTPAAFNNAGVLYGIQLGNPGNTHLKWETTKQTDVGLEMGVLDGRVTLEGDYFVKNTTDLLLNQALPAYVGGGTETKNVGEVQNKGFEITLTANLLKTTGFSWTSNFNVAVVKNKVASLGGVAPRILTGTGVGGGMSTTNEFVLQPGYSLGSYWGLKYLGTWKPADAQEAAKYNEKPGDSRYADLNNDGQINADDFTIIGKGIPTTTAGWNNTFTYKGFTLNVFFQGVLGVDKLNYTRAVALSGSGDARQYILSEIKDRYIPGENQTSNIPAFSSTNVVITQSSRFIENGSYVRLKNLSLAYTFPKVVNNRGAIKVFVSGTNLATITKYKGLDPEANNIGSGTDTAQGIDYGAYPNSRVYTLGVNLSY
ncbi:TonB-dependent receptor [Mucilaginibacter sabulilitoris]|uniref:TonB-dependent receptor n=1 Tax=Mucilaginibacter sabulilitoris TaxID=1173583 RepID=A0ABZ0TLA3_9SPHI|nr:TonB-dependent receptor [Mucilaginibacter sabulilitoris]WPU93594.1 TonB-dependent receptor [Mucilaginibacter sabulilitoris]